MKKLAFHSYAKLNLYLAVIKKRPDNYHTLFTLFERISLADTIVLKARRDRTIKIACNVPGVPCDHTNLAYRSAHLLQENLRIKQGVDIKITKRIPVASGMGGGSSNAATVLLGLNQLWGLGLTKPRLLDYARRIGSDVPFFIYNTTFASGENRGDCITPLRSLSKVRLWHVLVIPPLKVSTPAIYRAWDRNKTKTTTLASSFLPPQERGRRAKGGLTRARFDVKLLTLALRARKPSTLDGLLFNSLQEVTPSLYPEVGRIFFEFNRRGIRTCLMSGSGPAVFGVVFSRKEAHALGRKLKACNRAWQVCVASTR